MHEDLFFKILIPLMARKDHYLVALTTPKHSNDHFSQMVATRKEDGKPYYNVITMGEPCEDCAETQRPWECTHKRHEIASWKDPVRTDRWYMPYIVANKENILMQEQFSIGGMKDNLVFNTNLVNALDKRPPIVIDRPVDAIYLAIDPAGGGPGSDMSITAMAQYQSRFVVCICFLFFSGEGRNSGMLGFYFLSLFSDNSSRNTLVSTDIHACAHATTNAWNNSSAFSGVIAFCSVSFSIEPIQSTNTFVRSLSTHIWTTVSRTSVSFTMAASSSTARMHLSLLPATASNVCP